MAATVPIDQVLSIGVEEEFVLADASTRVTAPRAAEVVEKARLRLGDNAQHEFFATQVEFTTRPRVIAEEVRAELVRGRQAGAAAAADTGCLLVGGGSAVLTRSPLPVAPDARYETIARRHLAGMRSESSGCHVHVGTLTRGDALLLSNHLGPWLPALQALCVNSPFAAGEDRHCASWRYFDIQALPTVGPAPVLDEAGYERLADSLVADGTLLDRKMIYWYARLSEHCPTLEIRIADANPDLDVVMLFTLLVRGLATTLLAEARQGRPWPGMDRRLLTEAHRRVAVEGLAALTADPRTGKLISAAALLDQLVERSRPGLAAAGDEDLVATLLGRFHSRGTAAERQRAVYRERGRLTDVVDWLTVRP
jgi:glutamate---cysteine ligase / carboxylate-amine ligase